MAGLQLKYFVLKPAGSGAHAAASRAALRTYAGHIEALEPELARDLRLWVDREVSNANANAFDDLPDDYETGDY